MEGKIDMSRGANVGDSDDGDSESVKSTDDNNSTGANGSKWLSQMLQYLDKDKTTEGAATHNEQTNDLDSSDSIEFSTPDPDNVPRKVLNNMGMFFNDLSEVSGLARKSKFCVMTVSEEGWNDYKEFMYKSYRGYVNKNSQRSPTAVVPNEAAPKG
ncbi:hypothetical protein X943_003771 [Babesia divergens]|uniref:Uncharacterized protein n=1 Tax=Babesia divergens TaxID=32595 RepID=A0AAD9LMI3_BABDI|nr:hypothetical protein X943_003771 [Babesia divergens]